MRRAATRAWPVPSAPFPSSKPTLHTFRSRPYESTFAQPASIFQNIRPSTPAALLLKKNFSTSLRHTKDHAVEAKKLNQKGMDEQEKEVKDQDKKDKKDFDYNNQLDDAVGEARELQARTPWHREGSDKPPVRRMRQASAMTKGKLLTTPSRLLKLILPLTTLDKNSDRKDIEPLALLVHPQQPLSYLERLIQSELPLIRNKKGDGEKVPDVYFRAEDSAQEDDIPDSEKAKREEKGKEEEEGTDEQKIGGEIVKTGKIGGEAKEGKGGEKAAKDEATMADLRGGPGEGGVEVYSGAGRENESADSSTRFVRWSSSTEIGDFIRDAARGKEFAVEIEGASKEIRVGVPSFNDRTHYLRVRLRKTAKELDGLAKIKQECDELAHKSAQRLALSGFGVLLTWWGTIYYLTFQTSYGWDTMEPITYLAGLSTIMLGYLWFLYHNREVSYRAALNLTVSRRQNQLYQAKGFDVARWDALVEEANALRKEIKLVANEYDVDWDEKQDEGSEVVVEALRKERRRGKKKEEEDDHDDEGKGKEKAKKD